MNPTEIADALEAIAKQPFNPAEFGFAFADATDSAKATVAKLRGATNKSDLPGGVLLTRRFHYAPAVRGAVEETLASLRASKRTASGKPAILIATDGDTVSAEHPKSGDTLHCAFAELGMHFSFFLPAAGKDRYQAAEENPVDVTAAGKLAKLYDALLRTNLEWAKPARRHDMNQFMTRLIFCLFAERVAIFEDRQFSHAVFSYSGNKGEHARQIIVQAFSAMSLPKDQRAGLPDWAGKFEYVNGGLFAGGIDAPVFDPLAFRYLRDACELNWKLINPDIFGSMIQSIADPGARSELGMHYTSVPNIMKVLGPLFLDDLDAAIERSWDKPSALRGQLARLARIRVFDPACGSGNFLVVAYRELRDREIRLLERLAELEANPLMQMFSSVSLANFHGIELSDFAAETAKLALFIAEYQANARFADVFGRMPPLLPLRDGGHIVTDNALRIDWEVVCPPPSITDEVYIAGNPPYLGAKKRKPGHTEDMIACGMGDMLLLDYVSAWFVKAAKYAGGTVPFAFVATSSVCQGEQVAPLWGWLYDEGLKIDFAYRPFEWRNSAAKNAGVWVTVVGLSKCSRSSAKLFDAEHVTEADEISPYLFAGKFTRVEPASTSLFGLPVMEMGSNPVDGKRLTISEQVRDSILNVSPEAERFIKPYLGGDELLEDKKRYCLWIEDRDLDAATKIPPIAARIDDCRSYRLQGGRDARKAARVPHKFFYSTYKDLPSIAVPNSQSAERLFIPATRVPSGVVLSKEAFAIYEPPEYILALIASSLHRLWLSAVGGRIGNGFRYSVKIVYNTFPVPNFTTEQIDELSASARSILKVRYKHYPKTLEYLYDPKTMPDDLRAVHRENDDLLETMYVGRPFRNDTERLERLFKLYAAKAGSKGSR